MHSDTTKTNGAHNIERLHIIATVWTAALALRHIARGVSEETTSDPETWAVAQMLDTLVMQMQDAGSEARKHVEAGQPEDGVHVATIDGKVVLQRDSEAKTFAMALTRAEALDLVHDLTRELGPEAGVLVPEGGS